MSSDGWLLRAPGPWMTKCNEAHQDALTQATAETVDLSPPHAPKDESIKSFNELESTLKKELAHLRREHDKHEKEYFQAVVSPSQTPPPPHATCHTHTQQRP